MATSPWFAKRLRPELSGLRAYVPANAPPDAIRLDANECAYDLDADTRTHLAEALSRVDLRRYPDVRATRLRELIADRANAHPDSIVLGAGTDEVIALVLNALARPAAEGQPATVLYPDPSFVMYRVSALAHGMSPVAVPLDDAWDLDVAAFVQAISQHDPSVIFLPSPNNPTGNVYALDRMASVIASAPASLVLLDEAYGPFAKVSYTDLRRAHPHVGQLQTLSKVGFAAARVGWAILPVDLAREVDKVRQPYNLNALSQRAAELFLTAFAPFMEDAIARTVIERGRLSRILAAIPGVTVHPSSANFVWVTVPGEPGAVYTQLLRKNIVIRSFHTAGGRLAHLARITVGTPDEDDALVFALRNLL